MYNCKSCQVSFKTISLLRKHQWAKHPERFETLRKATHRPKITKKKKSINRISFDTAWAARKAIDANNSNGSITSLLNKLSDQRDLLDSAIALIKGVTEHDK